jgi:hypothetical protein
MAGLWVCEGCDIEIDPESSALSAGENPRG